jgi:hypothetical protein
VRTESPPEGNVLHQLISAGPLAGAAWYLRIGPLQRCGNTVKLFYRRVNTKRKENRVSYRNVRETVALALVLIAGAGAQGLDSNTVMGFETPAGWIISGNASTDTTASPTTTRTQGNFALALGNPADLTKLTSLPVASIASALAGVGDAGALFEVDVMLPIQQGNPVNRGSLELFISCPSRQLNNVHVGRVDFTGFRLGIYTTMKFPIPDRVRSALGGVSFNDLTFLFMLSSPGTGAGTYLFDNLRVHSVALVTANAGTRPPPGFGGSVDLVAIGNTPAAQLFDAGPVQVPDSFHLKLGTAGTTTVQLDIGYDGTPAFTCMYGADSSDPSGKSYILISCTGGMQAGDLVGASWARLTIVGGDPSMKIRAQLAKNPVGDLVGGGIIPPMPTFWGDSDGCIPAPVAGKIVTVSASCASQAAEASRIVTNYFNKVSSSNSPPNWIVTPVPEFARRHGNGSPHDNLTGPPPPPNDPPFDQEGHMNPGGTFDAYYRLSGDLGTNTTPDNHNTTHLEANFSGHAVLYGEDVNILSLNSTIDTDTGQATPTGFVAPKSTGSLHMFLFGVELPGGGSADATTGFNFSFGDTQEFDLPPVEIWVFSITFGAAASVRVDATGTLSPTAFNVILTPNASMGAHVRGSVGSFFASGGVDIRVDLLSVKTPIAAGASWFVDTSPSKCSSTLNFSLDGLAEIDSGGGEIDLVATFGFCPFCYDDSWTLFKWPPLLSETIRLFHNELSGQLSRLPIFLCQVPLNVTINSPASTAPSGVPIGLGATVKSPNSSATINCTNASFAWSVSSPDVVTGQGCNQFVTFNSSGSRTLSLVVTYNAVDSFGRTISETGSASESVTVTPLPPGSYIVQTNPAPAGNPQAPFNGQFLSVFLPGFPGTIQLGGQVIGSSGTTTTWTAKNNSTGTTTTIGTGLSVNWNVTAPDTYTITMNTSDGSTASMQVGVGLIPR